MTSKFKIGDIVEAFGLRGEIVGIKTEGFFVINSEFSIEVLFNKGTESAMRQYFLSDGRKESWHKDASLKFIERPVKEITYETNLSKFSGDFLEAILKNKLLDKDVIVTVKLKES